MILEGSFARKHATLRLVPCINHCLVPVDVYKHTVHISWGSFPLGYHITFNTWSVCVSSYTWYKYSEYYCFKRARAHSAILSLYRNGSRCPTSRGWKSGLLTNSSIRSKAPASTARSRPVVVCEATHITPHPFTSTLVVVSCSRIAPSTSAAPSCRSKASRFAARCWGFKRGFVGFEGRVSWVCVQG